jgi:hypothetical protein
VAHRNSPRKAQWPVLASGNRPSVIRSPVGPGPAHSDLPGHLGDPLAEPKHSIPECGGDARFLRHAAGRYTVPETGRRFPTHLPARPSSLAPARNEKGLQLCIRRVLISLLTRRAQVHQVKTNRRNRVSMRVTHKKPSNRRKAFYGACNASLGGLTFKSTCAALSIGYTSRVNAFTALALIAVMSHFL